MKKMLCVLVAALTMGFADAQVKGVENVVLIGSDGFGAFVMREHPEAFPNLMKLRARGSSTLEMRSVLPSSSAVNWASLLMGAGPELHGYTEWGSQTPDLPSRVVTENGTFPCIINTLRAKYPKAEMGALYTWNGIGYLFDTTAINMHKNTASDSLLAIEAVKYLKESKPKFSFFCFAEPDGAGHGIGWGTPEYIKMCSKIDGFVGDIIKGIEDAGMSKNTIVIFIADHGGKGTGHGGKTMQEMQVPYIVAGPGVKEDFKIEQSMMCFDNASTIAHILDAQQPQVWIGRPALTVFKK